MKNASDKYHFLGDVHYEKYHNSHKQKLLLFVGFRCHKEENIGVIYFENTHKKVSIHIFLITIAQVNQEKH